MVRTILDRKSFAAQIDSDNKALQELLDIYDKIVVPLLKTWNGKVYNKRFRTAVEIEIDKAGYTNIYLREKGQQHEFIELCLQKYPCPGNWSKDETLYFRLVAKYVDGNYRISESETLLDHVGCAWVKNGRDEIIERQQAVDNWEEYIKITEQLQKAIKTFNDLPYVFRKNIEQYGFSVYK